MCTVRSRKSSQHTHHRNSTQHTAGKLTAHTHMHTVHTAHSTHTHTGTEYTQPTVPSMARSTMQREDTAHRRSDTQQEQLTLLILRVQRQKSGEHPLSNSDIVSFLSVAAWILQCRGHSLLYHLDADPPTHRASAEGLQVCTAFQVASKPS